MMTINNFFLSTVRIVLFCFVIHFPSLSFAEDLSVQCVQSFLDFHRLKPGPLDNELGSKTIKAAQRFQATRAGAELPELSSDTVKTWCEYAKTNKNYATFLAFDGKPKGGQPRGGSKYDGLLYGDSIGQYKAAARNIKNPRALEFVALDNGMTAARIAVNYEDKGPRNDWRRNGRAGLAQRFELAEVDSFHMQPKQTYWYRMSVFIPKGTEIKDHLTITDFKPLVKNVFMDPIMAFVFAKNSFRIQHSFGLNFKCKFSGKGGRELTLCDQTISFNEVAKLWDLTGKWLHMVYRIRWDDNDKGSVHFWLNDKLIIGLGSDTMLAGTSHIRNKFGLYRGYYETQGKPSPDVSMYFAGIGRAQKCVELSLTNCDKLREDTEIIGRPGIISRRIEDVNDLSGK